MGNGGEVGVLAFWCRQVLSCLSDSTAGSGAVVNRVPGVRVESHSEHIRTIETHEQAGCWAT